MKLKQLLTACALILGAAGVVTSVMPQIATARATTSWDECSGSSSSSSAAGAEASTQGYSDDECEEPCDYNDDEPGGVIPGLSDDDPLCQPCNPDNNSNYEPVDCNPCDYNDEQPGGEIPGLSDEDPLCQPCNPDNNPGYDPVTCNPCDYNDDEPGGEIPGISDDDPLCVPRCDNNPQLPADSPDCYPCDDTGDIEPECYDPLCAEYELDDEAKHITGYWYQFGDDKVLIGADDASLGEYPAPSGEYCEFTVELTKDVLGQPPAGVNEWTIEISEYNGETYVPVQTVQLASGQTVIVTLPASYDGIQYKVTEVGPGQGTIVGYQVDGVPGDQFFTGIVGQLTEVVVTNTFAGVRIVKSVDDQLVDVGQTITYELKVNNPGGLALVDVVVDDLFPADIEYVSYTIVGNGANGLNGTCTPGSTPAGRDTLSCSFTGTLLPGASLPTIHIQALVGPGAPSNQHLFNQSRVTANYVVPASGPELKLPTQAISDDGPLECVPVDGEVCNISPEVITPAVDSTTTTSTTTPATTTTTSTVAQLPPPGPTSTVLVVPTTAGTPQIAPALPATGSASTTRVLLLGGLLLAAGTAAALVTRRRKPDMI